MTHNPKSLTELLPCPFCGSQPDLYVCNADKDPDCYNRIKCHKCTANIEYGALNWLIHLWNTRVESNQLTETQRKLDVAVETLRFYAEESYFQHLVHSASSLRIKDRALEALVKINAIKKQH